MQLKGLEKPPAPVTDPDLVFPRKFGSNPVFGRVILKTPFLESAVSPRVDLREATGRVGKIS